MVETGRLGPDGNGATKTSGRPDSSEVKAIHRPSGESREETSWNSFVSMTGFGVRSPSRAMSQTSSSSPDVDPPKTRLVPSGVTPLARLSQSVLITSVSGPPLAGFA